MAHEVSGILFGRVTGQRKFFQSDKTPSGALSDIPNLNFTNEITVRVHSQLKLLLFLSFTTPSLSQLSRGGARGFYDSLSCPTPTSLSLLSQLIERVRSFALL